MSDSLTDPYGRLREYARQYAIEDRYGQADRPYRTLYDALADQHLGDPS